VCENDVFIANFSAEKHKREAEANHLKALQEVACIVLFVPDHTVAFLFLSDRMTTLQHK